MSIKQREDQLSYLMSRLTSLLVTIAVASCAHDGETLPVHKTIYLNTAVLAPSDLDTASMYFVPRYPRVYAGMIAKAPVLDSALGRYIDMNQRVPLNSGRYLFSELLDMKSNVPSNLDLRRSYVDSVILMSADGEQAFKEAYYITYYAEFVVSSTSLRVDSGQLITIYFNGRNAIDESGHGDDVILVQKLVYLDRLRPCRGLFH